MARDYMIAVGGSGARCLEAAVHLAGAGLFTRPLHVLIIDPDQNNGNSVRTGGLIPRYQLVNSCEQPREPKLKRLFGAKRLNEQVIFRAQLNAAGPGADGSHPHFWQDPNRADRRFRDAIQHTSLSEQFKDFVELFYEKADLDMKMGKGYRGRPNVGAVTLMNDLRRTAGSRGNGLAELVNSVRTDLKSGEVRVFVFGSVFGGTGAAGLPTVPELLKGLYEETGEQGKLRFGCAMMAPYFTFPKAAADSPEGPSPDSGVHQVATQAALLHYSNVPPSYQHAYVIGAPELADSKAGFQAGGDRQENDSHYAEVMAALAARDFFSLPSVGLEERQLHYADGDHFTWSALPSDSHADRLLLKRRLIAFATFAHIYANILHSDLKRPGWCESQAWYRDNFAKAGLTLDKEGEALDALRDFSAAHLDWLGMVGQPVRDEPSPLFNWAALSAGGRDAAPHLGRLAILEGDTPTYAAQGYGRILEHLNRLTISYGNKAHPVGLLAYLLHQAVDEFVGENYRMNAE